MTSKAVHYRVRGPTQSGTTVEATRCTKGEDKPVVGQRMPGAGLICQPSSRTGENPLYGMIGGIEETSASFEARSAPRSYPTSSHIHCSGTARMIVAEGERMICHASTIKKGAVSSSALEKSMFRTRLY
jgi:hypothetical protein